MELDEESISFIRKLKDSGYAVVIFTPEELETVDPTTVEDALIEHGWDVISLNQ